MKYRAINTGETVSKVSTPADGRQAIIKLGGRFFDCKSMKTDMLLFIIIFPAFQSTYVIHQHDL